MIRSLRRMTSRGLLNPLSRAAIVTWAWNYRHEILRWGRSLWNEIAGRANVEPARALRTGRVLVAIAGEERLRNAPQLRKVTITDDVVDLDVTPGWSDLPRLVDKVTAIKGVRGVTVNGNPLTVA